jgi:hypothetical protein
VCSITTEASYEVQNIYNTGVQIFYAKGPYPLFWAGSGAASESITKGCIPKILYYCRFANSGTVPGSIPGGVTGFFSDVFPSDRTMALGSTHPLAKMSTRNISGGKGGQCVRVTTSPSLSAEYHENLRA